MTRAEEVVEATERLYRSLFAAALLFTLGMALWGIAIAPFNSFHADHARSVAVGAVLALPAAVAFRHRQRLYGVLRRGHVWLLGVAVIGVGALWIDGGWRSSYYLASYAALALAAVVADRRWSVACGMLLATGYVLGLVVNGYSWAELERLKDADSVVANTGGYLVAAYFFAAPVTWLGGFVARIHQVAGSRPRQRTKDLSPREIQVVQLVAQGLTNSEIGDRLVVSERTIQTHVANASKKAHAKNRAQLAVIAVSEGLVPPVDD